jgi:hypothetical protein
LKNKTKTKIGTHIFEKEIEKKFKSSANRRLTIISSAGSLLKMKTQTRTNFLLFEKSKPKLEPKSQFLF